MKAPSALLLAALLSASALSCTAARHGHAGGAAPPSSGGETQALPVESKPLFYGRVKSANPPQPVIKSPLPEDTLDESQLPSHFDWRNVNGQSYVTSSVNQHIPKYCGSCWIHGTSAAINDRIKVMRRGAFPDVMISRQNLVNCVPVDNEETGESGGCNGGDPRDILKFMLHTKVPDETCQTYVAENMKCDPYHICHNCEPEHGTCFPINVGSYTGYSVSEWGLLSGESAMKKEIFARGPIVCSIAATPDFDNNYPAYVARSQGVFVEEKDLKEADVNHNVEILGWGETEGGHKYWIGRNSWGTYWGEGGFFRIGRGAGEAKNLRVEADCQWMVPEFRDLEDVLDGDFSGDYTHGLLPVSGKRYSNRPEPSSKPDMEVPGALLLME